MPPRPPRTARPTEDVDRYRALAEWRYRIRKFLAFSESMARSVGLAPQHHQALLAIEGLPADEVPSLRVVAERLAIQPHSMVELVDRLVAKGLVRRAHGAPNPRVVTLTLTAKAKRMLERLSDAHWQQLQTDGPALIESLGAIVRGVPATSPPPAGTRAARP